jgi:hypothetical protein
MAFLSGVHCSCRCHHKSCRNTEGSGQLAKGGYFTTLVDPAGGDFALHVVKNSYDHAACTRPGLPPTEQSEAENVTFILMPSMAKPGATLAVWRSNFEASPAILFEEQADMTVSVGGVLTLHVVDGDYYTISTVRTARHGTFAAPTPPSQPRHPIPIADTFDRYNTTSRQPKLWMQMTGAWEVQQDATNTSNKVLRQMATNIPYDNWRGRFTFNPATVIGMREWQDVKIAASFRLPTSSGAGPWPASSAGACIGTRTTWVGHAGIYLCVGAAGVWNLTYSAVGSTLIANGTVALSPSDGGWHTVTLNTTRGVATGTYDGGALFTSVAVLDVDTGFATLSSTGWQAVEFDDVTVEPTGPDWKPDPPPPEGCTPAVAGRVVAARRCQTNGITAPDQAFTLVAQTWQIKHIGSQLCVTAASSSAGAALTLQPCMADEPLQAWQNDYSNIHHGSVPLTLMQANVTLAGATDGTVSTHAVVAKGYHTLTSWYSWTYFDSTHQLRNTRNPSPASQGGWGYPMCLALCKDAAANAQA